MSLNPCRTHLLVVIDVNVRLLPLASWDLALEHDVNLAVGSVLHLGQLKVGGDQAEQTRRTPNVTALASHCECISDD